ncbi:MAG: 1-deoxy-D-xylulose-5-phosphate synthase [Rikenellaceae bacterium]
MAKECNTYKILESVNSPEELKRLTREELKSYCHELRRYIIEECATNPGHLSSSLGVVELTAALHYTYDTPHDALVWDVGHQTYPHKIITGRREAFRSKRTRGGISGFPKMSESEYDSFGGGHASVSISAAYGIAKGAELRGEAKSVVAIIGDGSMTGGLAFEGLNNLGADQRSNVLVILNDNRMAIDDVTGALNKYLIRISTSPRYNNFKGWLWSKLSATPKVLNFLRVVGGGVKRGLLRRSNLFESFNLRYFGTVDGHDLDTLVEVLTSLRSVQGPKLLHVTTTKGKGYEPAENNTAWHAPGRYNPDTGERLSSGVECDKFQDVFGATLLELAELDSRVVGVTPAMLSGSSMNILQRALPHRCFDVGIAEGHAVTFSAGVAAGGMRPFCNIYSTFMQRAYDNVIHDVALQNLPVVMCLDRGGLVGEDGSTHHGAYDLAYLSAVPNLVVAAPRNECELRQMMYTALCSDRPFAIRYPRGCGEGSVWRGVDFAQVAVGCGVTLRDAVESTVCVVSVGTTAAAVACAIDRCEAELGFSVAHYDLRFAKPLDYALLRCVADRHSVVVTIEDGSLRGGVGECVASFYNTEGLGVRVVSLGIPDRFVDHGTPGELYGECGIDAEGVYLRLAELVTP